MRYELTITLREKKGWDRSARHINVELHDCSGDDLPIINTIVFNPDKAHLFKNLLDEGIEKILQDVDSDYKDNYYVDEMQIYAMREGSVANYFLWIDLNLKTYSVNKVNFEMKKVE